jgi:hypothetical protein
MNMPAFLASQRKGELHGFHLCNMGEGIIEVDAFPLHECTCHQASLVIDDGTGFIPLPLEHPLKGDRAVTTREISKLRGVVLLNSVHLRLHHERPRLTVVARKMPLCLQIMRDQSQHWLVTEKVLHHTIPQRLAIVVRVDVLLIVGEWSSELH